MSEGSPREEENYNHFRTTSDTSSKNEEVEDMDHVNGIQDNYGESRGNGEEGNGEDGNESDGKSLTGFEDDTHFNEMFSNTNDGVDELEDQIRGMESEYERLLEAYEQVVHEKQILDENIQQKDDQLIETTVELENESEMLKAAKNELKQKEEELKVLLKTNKTRRDISSLNQLAKHRKQETTQRSAQVVNDDKKHRIVTLRTELKLKDKTIFDLNSEIDTLRQISEKKATAIEELEYQVKEFQWKEDKAYELETTNNELTYQCDNLDKEIKTLQQITRMKEQTIEKLSQNLKEWQTLAETHEETKRKRDVANQELSKLKLKLKIAQESNKQKELEIERLLHERNTVPLKSLSNDKNYLRNAVNKDKERKNTLQQTIKWQEKQISILRTRLEALQQAVKDSKLSKVLKKPKVSEDIIDDRPKTVEVSMHLYNLMRRAEEELRTRVRNLEILQSEKETVIEVNNEKMLQLEEKKKEDMQLFQQRKAELMQSIAATRAKIDEREMRFKEEEKSLKLHTMKMKKKLFANQKRSLK